MPELSDLKIHVNGEQTFFLNQKIVSKFSGRLKKLIIKRGKRRTTQIGNSGTIQIGNSGTIQIDGFPGGPDGFELVSRFCYGNGGGIEVTSSNVCVLHYGATFLEMTEEVVKHNLMYRTASFLGGMADWSWNDGLICLKTCESIFPYGDSYKLAQKLIDTLVVPKISPLSFSSSSSSSSPETTSSDRFRLSSITTTPESATKPYSYGRKTWWFDDLTILTPSIIEMIFKTLVGSCGVHCTNSLLLTRFLLHYLLKSSSSSRFKKPSSNLSSQYGALAETAVHGVISAAAKGGGFFSCRGLFSVLRVVSVFGMCKESRVGLEGLIGKVMDQATLDDLLVRDGGGGAGMVYDVNLVRRLVMVFVNGDGGWMIQRVKKVARLVDKYLGEIAPDQKLEVSKFLGVAESLPDCGRDCFDGVYRAIDIYLQAHPRLPFEERSRLCQCLNYEKLTLEVCKDLAKNPAIPPRIAIQALMSQSQQQEAKEKVLSSVRKESPCLKTKPDATILFEGTNDAESLFSSEDTEGMRMNLQRMQLRVVELENVCRDMKGQMSRLIYKNCNSNNNSVIMSCLSDHHRTILPRLC